MHIMITRRCNMSCAHCCYACEANGEDMSLRTFKAAVDLAVEMNERVALAGGEPTVHPLFWDMMEYALSHSDDVFVQTNGKITNKALALSKMAAVGLITSGISQDEWHEPISPLVIKAFTKRKKSPGDKRFIRDISWDPRRGPQKAGRCDWGVEKCPMVGSPFVEIGGEIKGCGCEDVPVIGSVFDPEMFVYEYGDHKWKCWKGLPSPEEEIVVEKEEAAA